MNTDTVVKYGYFYPSLITPESAQRKMPDYVKGDVTWVNPHRMEDTAVVNNIDLSPFKDGIALMSCSDIGETVWLKRPDHNWDGPFVVADCANPRHMFAAICYKGEVAELGFKTAVEWGLATYENEKVGIIHHVVLNVEVARSAGAPNTSGAPTDYREWWLSNLTFVNGKAFHDMNFEC